MFRLMENLDFVSIVVPIYNVEKYIRRCVESLLQQTYSNIEYVFVDDCSTDSSINIVRDILHNYSSRTEQVKIIHHQRNRGLAAARNTGVANARGKYIIHVDSDDYVERNIVEMLVGKAEDCNADIVVCDYFVDTKRNIKASKYNLAGDKYSYISSILERKTPPCIWGKLILKDLYEKNNLSAIEGVNFGEDYCTMPRLVYYAERIEKIDRPLYHYVQYNNNSYSKNISRKSIEQLYKANEIIINFFNNVPDNKVYKVITSVSVVRSKLDLLKHAKRSDYSFIKQLYSDISVEPNLQLSIKDKLLLILVDNGQYFLARIYVLLGLFILDLRKAG